MNFEQLLPKTIRNNRNNKNEIVIDNNDTNCDNNIDGNVLIKRNNNNNKQKFWYKIKRNKKLINYLDSIICLIIFGPLTIFFWRGTWELMDIYYVHFKGWPTFFFSLSAQFSYSIVREPLQNYLNLNNTLFITKILPKIYIYTFGVISVMQWRSVWVLVDDYFIVDYDGPYVIRVVHFKELIIIWLIIILLLCLLKSFKNILSSPLAIDVDYQDMAFYYPTRYNIKVKLKYYNLISFNILILPTYV